MLCLRVRQGRPLAGTGDELGLHRFEELDDRLRHLVGGTPKSCQLLRRCVLEAEQLRRRVRERDLVAEKVRRGACDRQTGAGRQQLSDIG